MHQTGKRILSLLSSAVIASSFLSSYMTTIVSAGGSQNDSNYTDHTDRIIDFSYPASSAENLLNVKANNGYKGETVDQEWWRSTKNQFQWKTALYWTCNNSPNSKSYWSGKKYNDKIHPYSLRKFLESTDEADKYISLGADDVHAETKRDKWEPIKITTDKVLDLNGHTFDIRYDRNRNNSSENPEQNAVDISTHRAVAFEITNGATLTIIDSSAWDDEGKETGGNGTGQILFTGYMIDPFNYPIWTYTTRDLFNVSDGNLIVYGGTFQAGRQKAQSKSGFSWESLKPVIGQAVELGVTIAEYASGINLATAEYQDVLADINQSVNTDAKNPKDTAGTPDDRSEGTPDVTPLNGSNGNPFKKENEKTDTPSQKGERTQTIDEKKKAQGTTASTTTTGPKNPVTSTTTTTYNINQRIAQAENNIINKSADATAIKKMVENGFGIVDGIAKMFESKDKIIQTIHGTVVKVGSEGSFVAYGGKFIGYGSTPNSRNGVIEVVNHPDASAKTWDKSKNSGGVAYIYDGIFEARSGANVFNIVRENNQEDGQKAWQYTKDADSEVYNEATLETLSLNETNGVEVLYYQNQTALKNGADVEPIPINTSNIQVRGGSFRCTYNLINLAINGHPSKETKEKFRMFPGTIGSVNLGINSFDSNLIQDGRIQINDVYGDGSLVLMDERKSEEAGDQGLYHYDLFCGDTELRFKSYLDVYPNNDPLINATHSMALSTFIPNSASATGWEETTRKILPDNEDNIRAPYRQTEYYFDYIYDDEDSRHNYAVKPNFRIGGKSNIDAETDYSGAHLENSELWFYPEPRSANGNGISDISIGSVSEHYMDKTSKQYVVFDDRDISNDNDWTNNVKKKAVVGTDYYVAESHSSIRTKLHYITYKVYRVDPLTRDNLSESDVYGEDKPLLTVHSSQNEEDDYLKCILPLDRLEEEIHKANPSWNGYKSGEMYRIVLSVDEYMGIGYRTSDQIDTKCESDIANFLKPASTTTSIIFRCSSTKEIVDNDESSNVKDVVFTPVQWKYNTYSKDEDSLNNNKNVNNAIASDDYAVIRLLNGKAGMIDYNNDKIFNLYYQWWETDEKGNPIKMIAGTNNIYDNTKGDLKRHIPEYWKTETDGYTYCNTVDPLDENSSLYSENGLPKHTEDWTDEMIHMYGFNTPVTSLKKDNSRDLSLANNDVFKYNSDKCYIPQDMAGKYLRVKVIAVNPVWPLAFDEKQTFWSQPVKVADSNNELAVKAVAEYEEGMDYASCNHPAKLSVAFADNLLRARLHNTDKNSRPTHNSNNKDYEEMLKNLSERFYLLTEGEYISAVTYEVNGKTKEFTGLNVTDIKKLPAAYYPDDFYAEGYKLENIRTTAGGEKVRVKISTNKGKTYFRSTNWSSEEYFNYNVEAEMVRRCCSKQVNTFYLSDLKKSSENLTFKAFTAEPSYANTGFDYADHTNTNDKVAKLDNNGKIILTGKTGETTISVKSPDNRENAVTVRVIDDYYNFEISGIKPPVIGETLDCTSVSVPENAPYHITDVQWMKGINYYEPLEKDEKAEYFTPYTIMITVESNDFCANRDISLPFKLTAEQADGTLDIIDTSKERSDKAGIQQNEEYNDGVYTYLPSYTIRYTYPAQSNHIATTIDKVFIDMPTETIEGGNFEKWLENVHIYTNGNCDAELEFDIKPSYSVEGEDIAKAHGYDIVYGQLNYFIKGVQNGVLADIRIPEKLSEIGDKFAEKITLYVNGKESNDTIVIDSKHIKISSQGLLTVVDGESDELPIMPEYSVQTASINTFVGDTINVCDWFDADDPRINARVLGFDENFRIYCTYDEEEVIKPYKAGSELYLGTEYCVEFDADSDGYAEYIRNYNRSIKTIYANAEDVPEVIDTSDETVNLTALKPDGEIAYNGKYPLSSIDKLPQIEDAFISGVLDSEGKIVSSLVNGKNYTVKSVSPDEIEISSDTDTVYAQIKAESGKRISNVQISVDGKRFTVSDHISGLTPDTEYTLYYRNGSDGKIFTKYFRTAKKSYGVYIGHTPVTDENLGNIETDGWHYDPESKTLTLKDFKLTDSGTVSYIDMSSTLSVPFYAAIVSKDELKINLVGDNEINIVDGGLFSSTIYAEKELVICGNGNLTLGKKSIGSALRSKTANIRLEGSGNIVFDGIYTAFEISNNRTVDYINGNIEYKPYLNRINGEDYPMGMLLSSSGSLNFSDAIHTVKFSMGETSASYKSADESTIISASGKYLRIKPLHNDTKKVVSAEYHKSGECDDECEYHFSCECGHIGSEVFIMNDEKHVLVKHEEKPASCTEDGMIEYWECEHCGGFFADENASKQLTSDEIVSPKLDHKLIHHEAVSSTCTSNGSIEYWECTNCGKLFADEEGSFRLSKNDLVIASIDHNWVHYAEKPASCTNDGESEHWMCPACGKYSADEYGTKLISENDFKLDAFGHLWSEWIVSVQPTVTSEGEEVHYCMSCGEEESKVIPREVVTTTTTNPIDTTTTTTTTNPIDTTTTTTTTPIEGYSRSYAEIETQIGYYFSHDDGQRGPGVPGGFNTSQIKSIVIYDIYTINGVEQAPVVRENIDMSKINFNGLTPAKVFDKDREDFKYDHDVQVYYDDMPLVDKEGNPLYITAYIGVKGDANLDGQADGTDATLVLKYFAAMGAGAGGAAVDPLTIQLSTSPYVTGPADPLDALAVFLSDVTENEWDPANAVLGKEERTLDGTDATLILKYYALVGTKVGDVGSDWYYECWNNAVPNRFGN